MTQLALSNVAVEYGSTLLFENVTSRRMVVSPNSTATPDMAICVIG